MDRLRFTAVFAVKNCPDIAWTIQLNINISNRMLYSGVDSFFLNQDMVTFGYLRFFVNQERT